MSTPTLVKPAVKTPTTREAFRLLVIETKTKQAQAVSLAAEREKLIAEATAEIEKEHKFTAHIQKLEDESAARLAAIEEWCNDNREREFGSAKSLTEGGAKAGWHTNPWSVVVGGDSDKEADNLKASVKLLESIIAKGMKENASPKQKERADIARRYLKQKVDFSKRDALKDREDKAAAKVLEDANITFKEGVESFFFEPLPA